MQAPTGSNESGTTRCDLGAQQVAGRPGSILVIAWHLLSDPGARFCDLGPGYYAARIDPERRKQSHIRQLEALGYTVTLQPAS